MKEEAARLRAEGLPYWLIAERLGTPKTTVWRWLNPERNSEIERARMDKKRRWDSENRWRYRDQCPRCGWEKSIRAVFCLGCRRRAA